MILTVTVHNAGGGMKTVLYALSPPIIEPYPEDLPYAFTRPNLEDGSITFWYLCSDSSALVYDTSDSE